MASRDYTRHTVSSTAPAIARAGDEYYNPTTNTLYKSVAYNGTTVQWEAIPVSTTGPDYTISGNVTTTGNLSVGCSITGNTVMTTITEATVTNGNSGSTFALSLNNGTFQTIKWTANCTVTMPPVGSGKSFTLLANTGTPGPYTTTTFTGVRWPGGTAPTVTATANKADVFSFISDGTYWYGFYNQNY